jgi:hypothetical protein
MRSIRAGRTSGSRVAERGLSLRRAPAGLAVTAALSAVAMTLSSPALAATRPSVSTGGAREVSFASATLTGSLNPNGSDTSYYFQYGPTKLYGGQTAIADAGSGTHRVTVRLAIGGLQPITVYHYRLVAVNAAGAVQGSDETLLTTKVPLSLQILASPNPVLFGGTVTVQGTLSGTGNGNRAVVLQANTFPANLGFASVGNPELTTATGSFSFPVLGLLQATQFRVLTSTNPPVVSPVTFENVAVRVDSHVARTGRSHFARFYGTVTPAVGDPQDADVHPVHGRGVLVGGTILRHRNATTSKFSRVVPVERGVYRVLVRVINGAQVSNYGQPLLIH